MGFLDLKNRKSRSVKYAFNNPGSNSSWPSRNMIISGITVLAFLGLYILLIFGFLKFQLKYIDGDMSGLTNDGEYRYYHELHEKFNALPRVIAYVIAFIFLSFICFIWVSIFISKRWSINNKNRLSFYKIGTIFAIVVPLDL